MGPDGHVGAAEENLAGDGILLRGTPLEIRTENTVVAFPVNFSIGREKAHERTPQIVPGPPDEDSRVELLAREVKEA